MCHPQVRTEIGYFFLAADFLAGFFADLAAGFFFSGTDFHLRST
jgi:hypothetical protein